MPVRHVSRVGNPELRTKLMKALLREWRGEAVENGALIVTEGGEPESPKHVYVVWEAWEDLDQGERSEIIMDAAERRFSREGALRITLAKGLTRDEARRMKIARALGIE